MAFFAGFPAKSSTTAPTGLTPLRCAARAIAWAPVGFVSNIATSTPTVWIAKTDPSVPAIPSYEEYHALNPISITDPQMKIEPNVVHFVPA